MGDDGDRPASGRLRADKRAAIVAGALEVFASDGYVRASIGAIAEASGVSTRTIYKHFADKSALFDAVVAASAGRVAEAEVELVKRHLDGVAGAAEIEPALVGFAVAWLRGSAESAAHRALIGQVRAEAAHLGPDVVAAWWEAGPVRVQRALADRLAQWSDAGWLRIDDADRAAVHLGRLVSATPGPPGAALPERDTWIVAGVGVFVRGYRP
ncbi:TetR/AcrR family transcriptional regulator [Krasilnikoviella flava]|uniref:Transcriptional regulator, TetR family n=1 Tax=Krasilnikoviella flava TaxID=526729 RepID=A0A1T5IMT5_9MICO|nr:TetR/AcrR family transcriptional regulator [Krasilnikoviella flava]SKC40362.1 transcriptional regulator, TetR family [Krasilnikoviella flava]